MNPHYRNSHYILSLIFIPFLCITFSLLTIATITSQTNSIQKIICPKEHSSTEAITVPIPQLNGKLSEVSGSFRTRKGTPVEANINIATNNVFVSDYLFTLLPGIYQLCPRRDDDHTYGISTADIVRIQRHILGLESFTNSYAYLAADVNQSNTITASDVSDIRKLILGVTNKFPKVPSWIFVPKDTLFPNIVFPSVTYFKNYCRQFEVGAITKITIDFIAIKMGDVSENAMGPNVNQNQERNQNLFLSYSSNESDNTLLKTDFKLIQDFDLAGMQFTLAFNSSEYEFVKLENGLIKIDDDQISLRDINKGKIHIAWDKNPLDKSSGSNAPLFSIIWKKKSTSATEPILTFDPLGVKALIVDRDLNEVDLSLRNADQNLLSGINVYQDIHNQIIQITGQIFKESNATYSIIDITGREILQKSIFLNEGVLHESIPMTGLMTNSLYFFKIQSGSNTLTSKIIKL